MNNRAQVVVQNRHVTGLAAKLCRHDETMPQIRVTLHVCARARVCVAHLVVGHNEKATTDLRVKSQVGSGSQIRRHDYSFRGKLT